MGTEFRPRAHALSSVLQVGIRISHNRAKSPPALGKDERFHRSLKAKVPRAHTRADPDMCQRRFDRGLDTYNLERPREALAAPGSRYQPSPRPCPETLPAIDYQPHDIVRNVQAHAGFGLQGPELSPR